MPETSCSLWILEDDPNLHFIYTDLLNEAYQKTFFQNLRDFSEALSTQKPPDLVVADITVDDGSFLQFLSEPQNREELGTIPFVIISGDGALATLQESFQYGAFDYIIKPFKPNELIARIERIIQKHFPSSIETNSNQLSLDDYPELTLKEFQIFNFFMQHEQKTLERSEIVRKLWKDVKVHPKTLDVHLHNLKRKIRLRGYSIKSTGLNRWSLFDHN